MSYMVTVSQMPEFVCKQLRKTVIHVHTYAHKLKLPTKNQSNISLLSPHMLF